MKQKDFVLGSPCNVQKNFDIPEKFHPLLSFENCRSYGHKTNAIIAELVHFLYYWGTPKKYSQVYLCKLRPCPNIFKRPDCGRSLRRYREIGVKLWDYFVGVLFPHVRTRRCPKLDC